MSLGNGAGVEMLGKWTAMPLDWLAQKEASSVESAIGIFAILFGVFVFGTGLYFAVGGNSNATTQEIVPLAGSREDAVIASVNGDPIRLSDVILGQTLISPNMQSLPRDVLTDHVVDQIIDRRLMAEAAWRSGLERRKDTQSQIRHQRDQVLSDVYLLKVIEEKVTAQVVFKLYEERYLNADAIEEARVRHILVRSAKEAKAAASEIEKGAFFRDVARQVSIGAAGPKGGDLGYVTADTFDPGFWTVASELAVGEISVPFETRFGWHLVKMEDRRIKTPPRFKQVRYDLRNELIEIAVDEHLKALRARAQIERFGRTAAQDLDSTILASQ